MINSMEKLDIKNIYLLLLVFITMIVSGCAAPRIAPDLLAHVEKQNTPLINNAVTIKAQINPAINNYEKLDKSVKESLEIALKNANLFGPDSSHPYRINANIMLASESAWSFGAFHNRLKINYAVFDETNNKILDKTIYTEAESDRWYFAGYRRHARARAVNISKNVLQFVDFLQGQLKK